MNEKKICVIGAGRWGQNHIRTLDEMGNLGCVVETNQDQIDSLLKSYPKLKVYKELENAINEGFGGYVVATPSETHYSIGKDLLAKGCPTLIEKPLALTVNDAEELVELSEKTNGSLMVGHVLLFHPAIQKIKSILEQGKLGDLQHIYSNRLNLGTIREEENVFWSLAPHDISIFDYFIGHEPTEVDASGLAFVRPQIHDSTVTTMKYPGGIFAHIFVSWLHPFKEHRLVLVGSEGMVSFEDSSEGKDILFYEKGVDWKQGKAITRDGPTDIIPYQREQPLEKELRYFIDHLEGGIELSDGSNGLKVIRILEKVSSELKQDLTNK